MVSPLTNQKSFLHHREIPADSEKNPASEFEHEASCYQKFWSRIQMPFDQEY